MNNIDKNTPNGTKVKLRNYDVYGIYITAQEAINNNNSKISIAEDDLIICVDISQQEWDKIFIISENYPYYRAEHGRFNLLNRHWKIVTKS